MREAAVQRKAMQDGGDATIGDAITSQCRVDIAIALAPIPVVHRHRVTILPSLAIELPSRRPSP